MPSTLQRCNCQQAMKSHSQKQEAEGAGPGGESAANCQLPHVLPAQLQLKKGPSAWSLTANEGHL